MGTSYFLISLEQSVISIDVAIGLALIWPYALQSRQHLFVVIGSAFAVLAVVIFVDEDSVVYMKALSCI